jgi:hypothetical protein
MDAVRNVTFSSEPTSRMSTGANMICGSLQATGSYLHTIYNQIERHKYMVDHIEVLLANYMSE